MIILACMTFSVAAFVLATRRAPEMAFETTTHPARECEIIKFPLHRTVAAEDLRKAA